LQQDTYIFNSHNLLAINQIRLHFRLHSHHFHIFKDIQKYIIYQGYQIKNDTTFQVGMHIADYTILTVHIFDTSTFDSRAKIADRQGWIHD
jgi:hypothetical protein